MPLTHARFGTWMSSVALLVLLAIFGLHHAMHSSTGDGSVSVVARPTIYERALSRPDSRLVIIQVIDDRTGEKRTVCTFIDFLLRALQAEAGVAASAGEELKAREVALKTKDQTFHFRSKKALQFFPYRSDPKVLEKVRQILRKAPRMELIGLLQEYDRDQVFIERRKTFWESAQGLIEIGILPSYRCAGGPLLWVGENDLDQADAEKLKQWQAARRVSKK